MPDATTGNATAPREVLHRLLGLVAEGPREDAADLFAEDAVFEMPYLPPGAPAQEPGREAFRGHLREGARVQKFDGMEEVRVYATDDPELAVTEYRLRGHVLATGKRFVSDHVMFARVRDGLIVWSRVYANPLVAPEV
jgi:uncharacterized protein